MKVSFIFLLSAAVSAYPYNDTCSAGNVTIQEAQKIDYSEHICTNITNATYECVWDLMNQQCDYTFNTTKAEFTGLKSIIDGEVENKTKEEIKTATSDYEKKGQEARAA